MDDDLNLKVLINQEQVFAQLEDISKTIRGWNRLNLSNRNI